MKVFVITPLDKGYRVDTKNPDNKNIKVSGHNTRKNAVDRCLREIPKEIPFQITILEEPTICSDCPNHNRDKCRKCIHWNGTQTQ